MARKDARDAERSLRPPRADRRGAKTITTLSKDVVGLQDILSNKQARGAFGEVQLEDIVRMALAPDAFGFQVTLSNKARADCLIRLPSPPGPIAVDAKFPLESYAALRAASDETQRQAAQRQFRIDVMRHATAIRIATSSKAKRRTRR